MYLKIVEYLLKFIFLKKNSRVSILWINSFLTNTREEPVMVFLLEEEYISLQVWGSDLHCRWMDALSLFAHI